MNRWLKLGLAIFPGMLFILPWQIKDQNSTECSVYRMNLDFYSIHKKSQFFFQMFCFEQNQSKIVDFLN